MLLRCHLMSASTILQGTIAGYVSDDKNQPLPFANVLLLSAKDSTVIEGTLTDGAGRFSFGRIPDRTYLVSISATGYFQAQSAAIVVNNNLIELPPFILQVDARMLSELTVTRKKPFVQQEIDKTVINVSASIVSAGSSALEVLEKSPGVTIDQQSERLNLNGQQGVIVQIDGKQTFLSNQELFNMLRNMPSDNIETIELIANPSSKFDAAGNSGIINIKLKRNKNSGTNGNASLTGAYGRYGAGTATGSLNRLTDKYSFSVNTGLSITKSFRLNDIARKIPYEDQVSIFNQTTKRINKTKNYNARIVADYLFSPKTSIGILVSAFNNNQDSPYGKSNTKILDGNYDLQKSFQTNFFNSGAIKNLGANVNLRHETGKAEGNLAIDMDYVKYASSKNSGMNTRYFKPDGQNDGLEMVRNSMPSGINIGVAKLDYAQNIGNAKLETGIKSSLVESDNDMVFETKQIDWTIDPTRSNHFRYKESLNALYLNFNGNLWKDIKYQLGLRGEYTHAISHSVTLRQKKARHYLDLFPSVFISAPMNPDHSLNISFSRRIDRPDYESLNPFEFYLDPYTIIKGNPNLKSQYTRLFQVVHVFKKSLTSTLSYSRIKDLIEDELPVQIAAENKTILLTGNIDKKDRMGLTVSFPIQLLNNWSLQTNLIGSYNHYKSIYLGEWLEMKQLTFNVNVNSQIDLGKSVSAELTGWFNTRTYYGMYAAKPAGMLSLGVQKKLINNNMTLKINANDILGTNYFHGKIIYRDINYDIQTRWQSRMVRITATYNFGNTQLKPASKRNTGSDDLKDRTNNGQ